MIRVAYIENSPPQSGVGQQALQIRQILAKKSELKIDPFFLDGATGTAQQAGETIIKVSPWPGQLSAKSIGWWRLGRRLPKYLQKRNEPYQVFHLTNQTLSFLALKLSPSVITVHDIIELTNPQSAAAAWLNRRLQAGIKRAAKIIAVSHFTRSQLLEHLNVAADKITVIPNGVGEAFKPLPDFINSVAYHELTHQLRLTTENYPLVLYVGSEHPRKNLPVALEAFARLCQQFPKAIFIKVGVPGLAAGREELLRVADKHKIRSKLRFLSGLNPSRLNDIYNLADVLIHPATLEGFGMTVLEAMAAGTPVVCSNSSSLPEVVGDAALTNDPMDVEGFYINLLKVIQDNNIGKKLRESGLQRAAQFSWSKSAEQVAEVYRQLV